jgi:di/tricarboxylate transporter
MRIFPPVIKKTPEAAAFAARELEKMGPMSRHERILAVVFAAVCTMWATAGRHGLDITITALLGATALLLTGVLTWDDVKSEKSAWDMFIWYGGLVRLGKALNDGGVMRAFADKHGLVFFEDNCESLGAELDGKPAGTFGDISTFSTFFSHDIPFPCTHSNPYH